MHILLKCQIFRRGQRHLRRCDTLNGRVICQVDKEDGTVNGTCLLKTLDKEVGLLEGNTQRSKYNGKVFICSQNLRLSCDLRRQVSMGQTGSREDRQLLSADQCVQSVDGGNTGLDKLLRIASCRRIHGQTVDVHAGIRQNRRAVVNGIAKAVKDTSQHILRYAQLHAPSQETNLAVGQVDTCGALKQLYQCITSVDLQYLAPAGFPACKLDLSQFIVGDILYAAYQHQRACNFLYSSILFRHLEFLLSQ